MGAAPAGDRDGPEPQAFRAGGEVPPEIEMPGPGPSAGRPQPVDHLRPHFIAQPANANPTMHYDVGWLGAGGGEQALDPGAQDPAGRAAPSGVQQRHPAIRHDQVDRNAVGYGYGEEHASGGGHPAVDAVDLDPAAAGADGLDGDAMDLVAEDHGIEARQRSAEGTPAAHHLADRRVGPEAEVEAAAGRRRRGR